MTEHVDTIAEPGAPAPARGREVPWLALAAVVALLVPLRAAVGPVRDVDLYWHLLVGHDILAGTGVTGAGHGWSFAPVPDTWVSTQWLAEVLFARLEQWDGLTALIYYRVVMLAGALAVLGAVTLVRRPARAGVWLFALGALELSITSQERSQQLTYLLAPLLGWWAERLWRSGRLPQWWIVLPLVVVWANFHGGWILLPFVLVLAALARVLDHGWRDRATSRALLLAALSVAAACISPSGIDNLLAPRRFSASTSQIIEWGPVEVWDLTAVVLTIILVVAVLAWARGRVRPTRGELALVLLLVLFGYVAWRNVAPAVLVLAPILTGTLVRAMGLPEPTQERAPLARAVLVLGVVGTVLALAVASAQSPLIGRRVPPRLIAAIADAPSDQRVLNTYNVSGALLWFGGRPPHVQVAIDGRADRYGNDYITRYMDALDAKEGWQSLVDELAPTCALLRTQEVLAGVLVRERGWVEVAREGDYVLLHAPGAPGWPAS